MNAIHEKGTRLMQLQAKLRAREGKSEYKKNCEALRVEIARLEAATLVPASDTIADSDGDDGS